MSRPSRAPSGDPLLGRSLDDGSRLVERMHDGGLSEVYRAERIDGGASAVKLLAAIYAHLPGLRRRFAREAELARRLEGRGAARLLGSGVIDERPYLALELVEGELLAGRLQARRPAGLAVSEALRIGQAVLGALAHVHALGVVHGDVKPANVMLLPEGEARLLDLGAASTPMREAPPEASAPARPCEDPDGDDDDDDGFDAADVPLGTPAYAAPERIVGGPVDERADVYTMGVLLFEMLAGRRPFLGDMVQVLEAHLTSPPPLEVLARGCSAELVRVVERALGKSAAERFASVVEMAAALAAVPEARTAGEASEANED